jgi:hypothetical protein
MRKLALFVLLTILFLSIPSGVEAKINWPWQVRKEVRKEVQEELGQLTGTPSAGPFRQTLQKTRQELKEKLQAILPAQIKQAELKSISGTTAPADLVVARDSENITVKVSDQTRLLRRFGAKSELSEFSVGDLLNIHGKWTDDTKTTIEARLIRNISIQKRRGTFWGTIKSIDSGAKTLVLGSVNRGDQSVYPDGNTKIINRRQETISFGDLQVGHRVRVSGLWDSKLSKITEVVNIKDWSLPPGVTPTKAP